MANKFAKTFETWKKQASKYAQERLGLTEVFDEDDPYELAASSIEAFESEQDPKAYIREIFADDFNTHENDKAMERKARRHGDIF